MASNDTSLFSVIDETNDASGKAPNALRTISEASELLDIPQHVLRFWETKFAQIKPLKRNGGRRFYRPQDLDVLSQVKHLLYSQGYTIKGAQKAIADYVASRALNKQEVVLPLKPTFAPAYGNDNSPVAEIELDAELLEDRPVDELFAELAQALAEPEAPLFAAAPAAASIERGQLLALRQALVEARDELSAQLAA